MESMRLEERLVLNQSFTNPDSLWVQQLQVWSSRNFWTAWKFKPSWSHDTKLDIPGMCLARFVLGSHSELVRPATYSLVSYGMWSFRVISRGFLQSVTFSSWAAQLLRADGQHTRMQSRYLLFPVLWFRVFSVSFAQCIMKLMSRLSKSRLILELTGELAEIERSEKPPSLSPTL